MALRRLPDELREATELPGYREAMHTAAGQVKTILVACLARAAATPSDAALVGLQSWLQHELAKDAAHANARPEETAQVARGTSPQQEAKRPPDKAFRASFIREVLRNRTRPALPRR